jgi:DNA polymerase-1
MASYPTDPKFRVTIPDTSQSYKIEKGCEPFTEQMKQPLKVNKQTWWVEYNKAQHEVQRLTELARTEANWPELRPHAPADAAIILFDRMGLKPLRTTKTGKGSVDDETLQFFANQGVPIARLLADARSAQSCLSQLEAWRPYADDGFVKASWHQTGTPHGRYSCSDPNLQSRIHPIRHTVEAGEGYSFVSRDLGQAEYVAWASLSHDPLLTRAFTEGRDFHALTWDEIETEVPGVYVFGRDKKSSGKTINFAVLYLMQDWTLAKTIGCDVLTARKILNAHKARAPRAHAYIEETLTHFRLHGCIATTLFGRQRHIPDLRSSIRGARHQANKTAWNHHCAGTAAEALKVKEVRCGRALNLNFNPEHVSLALQMHDELIWKVRDDLLQPVQECIDQQFNKPIEGLLPFQVDARVGKTWGDITK